MMNCVGYVFSAARRVVGIAFVLLALMACGRSGLLDYEYGDAGLPGVDGSSTDSQVNDGTAADDSPSLFPEVGPGSDTGEPCNAMTCNGCCDGDTCVVNISADQCGAGGAACVQCQPGENCKGVCFHPQSNCGPSNCQGCCLGDNFCASGTSGVGCGTGGQQCLRCLPSEGTGQCVRLEAGPGGTCIGGSPTCGPENCGYGGSEGCCLNGTCVSGVTEAACGHGGASCQACPSGTFCNAGGGCRPGTPCTPQSCPNGCCGVDLDGGVCYPGTADDTCGSGGVACTDCQNAHEVCVGGVCGIPCSPSTCNGCCDGNVCAVGNQNFVCGTGGAACQNCETQGQVCVAGACR